MLIIGNLKNGGAFEAESLTDLVNQVIEYYSDDEKDFDGFEEVINEDDEEVIFNKDIDLFNEDLQEEIKNAKIEASYYYDNMREMYSEYQQAIL